MRSARVLSVVGVASLLAAIGCSSNDSSELGSTSQALLTEPLLNEVSFNPPSTDNPYEYVEIKAEPNTSLTGYQFVYLEGDNATTGSVVGQAKRVTYLTGATTGSSGLLLVKSNAGGFSVPAGANVFPDAMFDVSGGGLENGSGTFLLVKGTALTQGTDYDANDDGVLELPAGAVVVDSVSVSDGGATDKAYGPLATLQSGTPGAVSRFLDDDTPNSAPAWYAGALSGPLNSDLPYSTTSCSAVMPANAALTPGIINLPRPAAVDGGAGSDSGSTPVDAGSTPVDAGSTPVDAGSTPVDAGSTQDASVPPDSGSPAVDAGSVQDASSATDAGAPTLDASYPPDATDPYLNEIEFNPGGTDNPYEYIELKGAAGVSLAGYQVVYLEGDSGASLGKALIVFPLGSASLGSSGFAVLKSAVGGHTIPSGATVIGDNAFDATNGVLQNGTGTFLLVRGGTFVQGVDYDTNDDGTLELPAGAVIVDAVGVTDGGTTDKVYGPTVATASGAIPGALSRLVGDVARSTASSWFGATLSGANTSLAYDASPATANMPAGATLTPGAENSQGAPATPDAGAPIVDAGSPVVDAGPRDAGTPVVDAGVRDAGSPVVDAGTRDAGTPVADAGTRDAGTPPTDAGARDAGAPPAEQTFGEDEGGCGCAVVGSPRASTQPLAWVALGGFAMLVARRRRR